MAAETKFTIGVRASCSDAHCREVRRLIIDPATNAVTHLVIQPGRRKEATRLVWPVALTTYLGRQIRLASSLVTARHPN